MRTIGFILVAATLVACSSTAEPEDVETPEAEEAPTTVVPLPPPPAPIEPSLSWTVCATAADCPTDCGPMTCFGKACAPVAPLPDETPCLMPGNPKPHFCRSGYCVAGCDTVAGCEDLICKTESCDAHLCVWTPEDGTSCSPGPGKAGVCQHGGCVSN